MSLVNLGLTVKQRIPPETWTDLMTGQYTLSGICEIVRYRTGRPGDGATAFTRMLANIEA
jgi:hypothetical protein